MSTLTLFNALPVVDSISPTSQLLVNETSTNNTLSRITVQDFLADFLPEGVLISNAGGTSAALDISNLFSITSLGTDGLGTLVLAALPAGELLGNPTGSTAEVVGAALSEYFDSNFGSTEGQILYRGAGTWLSLAPGSAGEVLVTQGAGEAPGWETISVDVPLALSLGSDTITSVSHITLEGLVSLTGGSGSATMSVTGGGGSLEVAGSAGGSVTNVTLLNVVGASVTGADGTASFPVPSVTLIQSGETITTLGTIVLNGPNFDLTGSTGEGTITFVNTTYGTNAILGTGGSGQVQVVALNGLTYTGGTLTASGGSAWEISDGTHTVNDVTELVISGATVSGASGVATLAIASSGSSLDITDGVNTVTDVSTINLVGAAVSGSGGDATIIIGGSIAGTSTLDPKLSDTACIFSNGNLTVTTTGSTYAIARSNVPRRAGKLYFEVTCNATGGSSAIYVGVMSGLGGYGNYAGTSQYSLLQSTYSNYTLFNNTGIGGGLGGCNTGDVFSVAVDFENGNYWARRNGGQWNGSGTDNPATNTGGLSFSLGNGVAPGGLIGGDFNIYALVGTYNNSQATINFGASSFAYAVPSGFAAWL